MGQDTQTELHVFEVTPYTAIRGGYLWPFVGHVDFHRLVAAANMLT